MQKETIKLNHNGYCHARYTLEIARQFKLHAKSKLIPLSLSKLRTLRQPINIQTEGITEQPYQASYPLPFS